MRDTKNLGKDIKKLKNLNLRVGIALVDEKKMRKLNRQFSKKNSTTDVLSFEIREEIPEGFYFLGDVVVNLDQAKKQVNDFKCSFREEIARLISHGVLHLLDFKDKDEKGRKEMREIEDSVVKTLK